MASSRRSDRRSDRTSARGGSGRARKASGRSSNDRPAIDPAEDPFGRLALAAGLVTRAQLKDCAKHLARAGSNDAKSAVRDMLVERGYLTRQGSRKVDAMVQAEQNPDLKIPGYEIVELLGQGGMGTVYLARQLSLDRHVALKVLDPEASRNPTHLERFMTEARVLARLNHENIIAGIDVGQANGYHYFAMEYVEGDSLDALIAREGYLADKRALAIGAQICRALTHAQRAGLVHRDVKPQNIMLTRHEQAKLCDLGLAMTEAERKKALNSEERGQAIGTPHYVSPEQARGERAVDIRSDLYSLGATLYHAVTGKTPFEGGSAMILMTKHLTDEPVAAHRRRPGVGRAVSDMIAKLMAKDPADRYQDPASCLDEIERLAKGRAAGGAAGSGQQGGGGAAGMTTAATRMREPVGRRSEARDGGGRSRRPLRARKRGGGARALAIGFVAALTGALGFAMWKIQQDEAAAHVPEQAPPSEEEQRQARDLLTAATDMVATQPQNKAGAEALFRRVVDAHPRTFAASTARAVLESEYGVTFPKDDEETP